MTSCPVNNVSPVAGLTTGRSLETPNTKEFHILTGGLFVAYAGQYPPVGTLCGQRQTRNSNAVMAVSVHDVTTGFPISSTAANAATSRTGGELKYTRHTGKRPRREQNAERICGLNARYAALATCAAREREV
jgi:hypothetical protein